jgi:hydroxymethylpyrimidine pyrophosphatase-like HAD family hydrolase
VSVLVASDLDGTIVFSARSARVPRAELARMACVERIDDVPAGFMTVPAAEGLARLAAQTTFVPVTTRSPSQFTRVALPAPSRFAVVANGGVLYVDGVVEPAWSSTVATRLVQAWPLVEMWEHAAQVCRPEWTTKLRNVESLFCYAVVRRSLLPAGFVAEQAAWADARGWRLSLQGRKLYWVPRALTKSAAVAEIARRVEAELVLAAGDSLLDVDLLEYSGLGIHPAHGELAASGWSAPHVTRTAGIGVHAGAEIVEWLGRSLRAQSALAAPPAADHGEQQQSGDRR